MFREGNGVTTAVYRNKLQALVQYLGDRRALPCNNFSLWELLLELRSLRYPV